jgi:hypothetical protein
MRMPDGLAGQGPTRGIKFTIDAFAAIYLNNLSAKTA